MNVLLTPAPEPDVKKRPDIRPEPDVVQPLKINQIIYLITDLFCCVMDICWSVRFHPQIDSIFYKTDIGVVINLALSRLEICSTFRNFNCSWFKFVFCWNLPVIDLAKQFYKTWSILQYDRDRFPNTPRYASYCFINSLTILGKWMFLVWMQLCWQQIITLPYLASWSMW